MADESFGEKTEAPTPRRIEEARERGQVPRSVDLTAALILLAGMAALYLAGDSLGSSLLKTMQEMLEFEHAGTMDSQTVLVEFARSSHHFVVIVAPVILSIAVMAVLANLMQSGLVFTSHPLQPSLDKLNPLTGFGRIFSKRALARLAGNLLKLGGLSWVAYVAIRSDFDRIVALSDMSITEMLRNAGQVVVSLGFKLGAILLVVAVFDYLYQRWQYTEDLKMTKQEVREEMKRMEGDPMIREQRRHIQRQLAMQRMSAAVPKADAVITNPTHFAIAIRYDSDKMAAPQVVAKGADLVAKRIREIAMEHGVPIVEKPTLARALYKAVEVGQEIPMEFYQAVAEVLAFVYRISGRQFARTAT
ncbi:MAG: flagellar biosynthesis protein FlhB [Planctomycetes bacterium]|nr:flagellar biosynthesis protein FlhB [Planctomycetota bacterium]